MRRRLLIPIVIAATFLLPIFGAGEVLSHHAHRSIGTPPPDLSAQNIKFHDGTGQSISGWMVHGKPGAGVVLLLHGVRADRREMLGRARFLKQLDYSVLLIDLPAHGESSGEYISYGLKEAQGVKSALTYLARTLPSEKVGVIGVSLGAAALVLAKPTPAPSAVVLESMFPTIREAVTDRLNLYLGSAGEYLAPLLLWQMPLRFSISPDQLRPIQELAAWHAPILIAAGAIDQHTTLAETKRIFAAANQPKQLWVVDAAAHVDLHAFDTKTYEAKISTFLAQHLRTGS
ncbi:MAG: alpha/beta hydrolase [Pseudomonadota bacterium]